jgi:hypothetical protein
MPRDSSAVASDPAASCMSGFTRSAAAKCPIAPSASPRRSSIVPRRASVVGVRGSIASTCSYCAAASSKRPSKKNVSP